MHAVLITVDIEPGQQEAGLENLRTNVVPQVKQLPGIVSGNWLSAKDRSEGLSVLLFENEEAAQAAAQTIPNSPRPPGVTLGNVEVREVVASF
jgi:Antibiotic biosynthesis monooxygenase